MTTVADIFKAKKFLTTEQDWDIIDIFSKNCNLIVKAKVRSAIMYNIYSSCIKKFWERFKVTNGRVVFKPSTKFARTEVRDIRLQLLKACL